MKLLLQRELPTEYGMFGRLYVDGAYQCHTLERSPSDPEYKPIPPGTYPLRIVWSNHFRRDLLLIENVPERNAIEIHPGNWDKDTKGCVLVGTDCSPVMLYHSKVALDNLMHTFKGPGEITILDPLPI